MSTAAPVSYVAEEFPVLLGCLSPVTDTRKARGKVHPLTSLLALTVLGLMAGKTSLSGIVAWAAQQPRVWECLGLRRCPSVATLWRLLHQVSVQEVREALLNFALALRSLRQPTPAADAPDTVVALDGKTLRGTREAGVQLHVLHAFATESALLLDQCAIGSHFAEPAAAQQWVEEISARFPGLQIFTGDALYAEQSLCAALVQAQKDYLVRVKKTSPRCSPTSRNSSPIPSRPAFDLPVRP